MTILQITDTLNASIFTHNENVTIEIGDIELTDRTTLELATAVLTEAIDHITMNDELYEMVIEARANLNTLLWTMRRGSGDDK